MSALTLAECIANTEGEVQSIVTHTLGVMAYATARVEDSIASLPNKDEYIKSVRAAAFFHDIGKLTNQFQKKVTAKSKKGKTSASKKNKKTVEKPTISHQQISCAIFKVMDNRWLISDYKNNKIKNLIKYAIYWHHASKVFSTTDLKESKAIKFEYSDFCGYNEDPIFTHDVCSRICEFLNSVGSEFFNSKIDTEEFEEAINSLSGSEYIPYLFNVNSQKLNFLVHDAMYVLNTLMLADRFVSSLSTNEINDNITNGKYDFSNSLDYRRPIVNSSNYIVPGYIDTARFIKQCEIADYINNPGLCAVNMSTGSGKSLCMLKSAYDSPNRTLIVVPRNFVADTVYDELVQLNKDFGMGMRIQKLLASSVIDTNYDDVATPWEDCDIIVTNIDNYCGLFNKHEWNKYAYDSLNMNLFFDEYHELSGCGSLFPFFVNTVRLREKFFPNSSTAMFSATPSCIPQYLALDESKWKYYPAKGKHYPSVYNQKFNVHIRIIASASELMISKRSINFHCSIRNAQTSSNRYGIDIVVHSKFLEPDRCLIVDRLNRAFGKNNNSDDDSSISSALMLQASTNMSFENANISVLSPEYTMQPIGRVNRFNECKHIPELVIFKYEKNQGEQKVAEVLYSVKLRNRWFDFLMEKIGDRVLSLDELYCIYNEFNTLNKDDIIGLLRDLYTKGVNNYEKYGLYPKHRITKNNSENEDEKDVDKDVNPDYHNRSSLRSVNTSIYILPQINNSVEFPKYIENDKKLHVIPIPRYTFISLFKNYEEVGKVKDNEWNKRFTRLIACGYTKIGDILDEYNKFKKHTRAGYFNLERLLKIGSYTKTPIPIVGSIYSYSKVLGLIDNTKQSIIEEEIIDTDLD